MVEILLIPPDMVPDAWPMAEPLLVEPIGMSRGCYEPQDVMVECAAGECQLWLATSGENAIAAYVTKITQYPRKRVVRAMFAGGKPGTMQQWLEPMVKAIEDWSRTWGCTAIEAAGRKGWSRVVDGEQIAVHLWRDFPAMQEVH